MDDRVTLRAMMEKASEPQTEVGAGIPATAGQIKRYYDWLERVTAARREIVNALPDLLSRIERAEAENKRLSFVIERDRSQVASGLHGMSKAIAGRAWLSEPGRGSYEWDDERYQQEFGHALGELAAAMEPLRILARDWSDCPTDPLDIAEARALLPLDKEKVG
jgi:hypothetical protein